MDPKEQVARALQGQQPPTIMDRLGLSEYLPDWLYDRSTLDKTFPTGDASQSVFTNAANLVGRAPWELPYLAADVINSGEALLSRPVVSQDPEAPAHAMVMAGAAPVAGVAAKAATGAGKRSSARPTYEMRDMRPRELDYYKGSVPKDADFLAYGLRKNNRDTGLGIYGLVDDGVLSVDWVGRELSKGLSGEGAQSLGAADLRQAMRALKEKRPDIHTVEGIRTSGAGEGRLQRLQTKHFANPDDVTTGTLMDAIARRLRPNGDGPQKTPELEPVMEGQEFGRRPTLQERLAEAKKDPNYPHEWDQDGVTLTEQDVAYRLAHLDDVRLGEQWRKIVGDIQYPDKLAGPVMETVEAQRIAMDRYPDLGFARQDAAKRMLEAKKALQGQTPSEFDYMFAGLDRPYGAEQPTGNDLFRSAYDSGSVLAPGRSTPQVGGSAPGRMKQINATPDDVTTGTVLDAVGRQSAPIRAYHGTYNNFDRFDDTKTQHIGPHFGTREQARQAAPYKGREIPVNLDMKRPLEMPDMGDWNMADVATALQDTDPALASAALRISQRGGDINAQNRAFRKAAIGRGYDGIRYANEFEGDGASYIAIKPGTVKNAETGEIMYANPSTATIMDMIARQLQEREMGEAYRRGDLT
jgi:hypothetical protein